MMEKLTLFLISLLLHGSARVAWFSVSSLSTILCAVIFSLISTPTNALTISNAITSYTDKYVAQADGGDYKLTLTSDEASVTACVVVSALTYSCMASSEGIIPVYPPALLQIKYTLSKPARAKLTVMRRENGGDFYLVESIVYDHSLAVCSIDVNTDIKVPAIGPDEDVDISNLISNPIGSGTIKFVPGRKSSIMGKGILEMPDGYVNGYYSINNEPLIGGQYWEVSSDSSPSLHIRSITNAVSGTMSGVMTVILSCS